MARRSDRGRRHKGKLAAPAETRNGRAQNEARQPGRSASFAPLSNEAKHDGFQQTFLPASLAPDVGNVGHSGVGLDDQSSGSLVDGRAINEQVNKQSDHLHGSGGGRGGDLRLGDDENAIQHRQVDRITGGRGEVTDAEISSSIAPMLSHFSNLPTSGQKEIKPRKKRHLPTLPTSGQNDLKSLMPTLPNGFWWECPADDKGFKIRLRWRGGQPPHTHVFARVGKQEFQTLKEMKEDERRWNITDRIKGELLRKDKRELAHRIGLIAGND